MKGSSRKEIRCSQGNAVIEFILAVPLLLYIGIGSIELYQTFNYRQILSTVAREIGNTSIRLCTYADGETDSEIRQNTEECLTSNSNRVLAYVNDADNGILPGVDIVARVYEVTGANPTLRGEHRTGSPTTRFAPADIAALNSYQTLRGFLDDPNRTIEVAYVVTVEVYYSSSPMTAFVPRNFYELVVN